MPAPTMRCCTAWAASRNRRGAKAHRWAPWSAQALKDLGDGRLLLGEKRSGLAALRAAAAKDPGDWEIWFDIAAATDGSAHRRALARAKALNPLQPRDRRRHERGDRQQRLSPACKGLAPLVGRKG